MACPLPTHHISLHGTPIPADKAAGSRSTGRIPVLVDNSTTPPFTVMETSAELLYLLKFADSRDVFGFKDELERSECLQWLFFWHGSGAPYQGQVNHFTRAAKEKIPCTLPLLTPSSRMLCFDPSLTCPLPVRRRY